MQYIFPLSPKPSPLCYICENKTLLILSLIWCLPRTTVIMQGHCSLRCWGKIDRTGCARLFFFFLRTRHVTTFSSFISPLSKWNYYPCSCVSSIQVKYLNKWADDTFNPTKDCNIGAEVEFPAKHTGLTLSPQPWVCSVPAQAQHSWPFSMICNLQK